MAGYSQHCRTWSLTGLLKLKFHGTDTDTDTDTDTNFLADFRARILARKSACPARAEVGLLRRARPVQLADKVRGLLSDARFSSRGCPLGMRACTRLQTYTIGASLKSVLVSVSVPWNLSLCGQRSSRNSNGITPYGGDNRRRGRLKSTTFDK